MARTIRTISITSPRWSSSSIPAKIGMWLFLATEVLLFGGLFVGFGLMQARYPREFVEAHEHLQRPLGALNTVVLLISSFTMVMGFYRPRAATRRSWSMLPGPDHRVRLHLPGGEVFRVFAQIRGGPAAAALVSRTATIRRRHSGGSHGYATFFASIS